ncbi:MAG: STAS domain-containing protein [Hamadaea sp.]|nr:STAS domain-containing protein [Hamadaea sp.]
MDRADVPLLCARLARAPTTVVCDVSGLTRVDAVTVEALARLQLTARRLNRRLIVRGADEGLLLLLTFMGLNDVLLPRSADPPPTTSR